MINIDPKYLKIIQEILIKYPYSFYIFGSRVTGKAYTFSDIDLFFTDKIDDKVLRQIREDFEESRLPYKVDIIDYNKCDPEFQKIITQSNPKLISGIHHPI